MVVVGHGPGTSIVGSKYKVASCCLSPPLAHSPRMVTAQTPEDYCSHAQRWVSLSVKVRHTQRLAHLLHHHLDKLVVVLRRQRRALTSVPQRGSADGRATHNLAVTVAVRLADHLVDLLIGELLAEVGCDSGPRLSSVLRAASEFPPTHDVAQLSSRDEPVAVLVKDLGAGAALMFSTVVRRLM